jgi:hypothetical protein
MGDPASGASFAPPFARRAIREEAAPFSGGFAAAGAPEGGASGGAAAGCSAAAEFAPSVGELVAGAVGPPASRDEVEGSRSAGGFTVGGMSEEGLTCSVAGAFDGFRSWWPRKNPSEKNTAQRSKTAKKANSTCRVGMPSGF